MEKEGGVVVGEEGEEREERVEGRKRGVEVEEER